MGVHPCRWVNCGGSFVLMHSSDTFSSANIKNIVIFLQWMLLATWVQGMLYMYIPCVNGCEPDTSKP